MSRAAATAIVLLAAFASHVRPAAGQTVVAYTPPGGASGSGSGLAGLISAGGLGRLEGALGPGDRQLPSGEYAEVHSFEGRRGLHVVLRAVSREFDAYLIVRAPSGAQRQDDDTGKGTHARLDLVLEEDGPHQVAVTSARPGETGAYVLEVRSDGGRLATVTGLGPRILPAPGGPSPVPMPAGLSPVAGGRIRIRPGVGVVQVGVGDDGAVPPPPPSPPVDPPALPGGAALAIGTGASGSLAVGDDSLGGGEWVDWYELPGAPGASVAVTLESRQFDAYLLVLTPDGAMLQNDDVSAGNTDARIAIDRMAAGTYRIGATSYRRGERGEYRIRTAAIGGEAIAPAADPSGAGLRVGDARDGTLAADDERLGSGEFVDWYSLQVDASQPVTIDLQSSQFDPYLIVVEPSGRQQDNDDIDEQNRNARLALGSPDPGIYQVGVTSYQPGEAGGYALRVSSSAGSVPVVGPGPGPGPQPVPSAGGTLTSGRSVRGELAAGDAQLGSGEFYDVFTFQGTSGQSASIDMVSAGAIDPYLVVVFPSGRQAENDDFGPNDRNSRISLALPETGEYRVMCTSYAPGETGAYDVGFLLAEGSPVDPGPSIGTVPNQNRGFFGVFVGISDYPGTHNDLPLCREDAEKLAATFGSVGLMDSSNVEVFTDGRASAQNVRAALARMASRVGPDDVFVFFYSGHGSQSSPNAGAHPDEVDGRVESIILGNDEYTDDEMARDLDGIHAGLTVVALDSCFSGGFARDVVSRPNRVGLFSSEEDLTSAVAGEFQAGGYLSHFFQKAIEGYADLDGDGLIRVGELSHYLQDQYAQHVRNVGAHSADGASGYQHLVVDRGAVRVDTLFFRRGAAAGAGGRVIELGF